MRYLLHHNDVENTGYRTFLNTAITPTLKFIRESMLGLDYGCGPSPALATMLQERGINCAHYDPFFFPSFDQQMYDFIFCTECVEHFYAPRKTFDHIDHLLKSGGYLTIMTSFWDTISGFPEWYYKNDPAHVALYHKETWVYLAEEYQYEIVYCADKKVVIFKKK